MRLDVHVFVYFFFFFLYIYLFFVSIFSVFMFHWLPFTRPRGEARENWVSANY